MLRCPSRRRWRHMLHLQSMQRRDRKLERTRHMQPSGLKMWRGRRQFPPTTASRLERAPTALQVRGCIWLPLTLKADLSVSDQVSPRIISAIYHSRQVGDACTASYQCLLDVKMAPMGCVPVVVPVSRTWPIPRKELLSLSCSQLGTADDGTSSGSSDGCSSVRPFSLRLRTRSRCSISDCPRVTGILPSGCLLRLPCSGCWRARTH